MLQEGVTGGEDTSKRDWCIMRHVRPIYIGPGHIYMQQAVVFGHPHL
jgi:hypothetical protein